jgi:hypothetical protein
MVISESFYSPPTQSCARSRPDGRGLHPATLGTGLEACSGDMLLEALVACAGVTLEAVATAIDYRRCEPRRNWRRASAKPSHPGPTRLGARDRSRDSVGFDGVDRIVIENITYSADRGCRAFAEFSPRDRQS